MKELQLEIEELEQRIAPIVIGGLSGVVSGEAVLEPTISASLTVTPGGGESIVEGCVSGASPGPGLTGLDLHHLDTPGHDSGELVCT